MEQEILNQETYIAEMNAMIDKAIARMKQEKPGFEIFTASIWTDPDAAASAINFDSKEKSLLMIKNNNEWQKSYYDKYVKEGDLESAELFKPYEGIRYCNPADFELHDFEEINHSLFPQKWYPSLVKIGKYAFDRIVSELNIDNENFELGINSRKDWYDKTWNIATKKQQNPRKSLKSASSACKMSEP